MDSHDIQDKNKIDYQRKQNKLKPPPLLRIGEYHPQTGRYEVLFPNGGKAIAGNKLFNSSTPTGTPVRATQAFATQAIALDYRNHQPIPVIQEQETTSPQLSGFIVWNTGFTKNGYADRAVDFFSGITDRDQEEWKNSVSNADVMPSLAGLKLIYIPMPGKELTDDEITRLKEFNDNGGIVFVTGEHGGFTSEKQKANKIMEILGSPIRCADGELSYGANPDSGNLFYPVDWPDITALYGNLSCEITGGTSISRIPSSDYSPGTNITWIVYDKNTRTILSGDVDWASQSTPPNTEVNITFAQSLLNLQW